MVPPSVHLLDITGPIHIFHEAQEYGAPLCLHFLALQQNGKVPSSAGLFLSDLQDFTAFSLTENDLLFLPRNGFQHFDRYPFPGWLCAVFPVVKRAGRNWSPALFRMYGCFLIFVSDEHFHASGGHKQAATAKAVGLKSVNQLRHLLSGVDL